MPINMVTSSFFFACSLASGAKLTQCNPHQRPTWKNFPLETRTEPRLWGVKYSNSLSGLLEILTRKTGPIHPP